MLCTHSRRKARTIRAAVVVTLLAACTQGGVAPAPRAPRAERCDGVARQVTSGEATIEYQVFGHGPPIIIINGGFGLDSYDYDHLACLLGPGHQAVIFDPRGTGRSKLATPSTDNLTMDWLVYDLEAIRRALGVERWNVLGHSFGGMVAAYYAVQHPDRVEKLVLSSTPGVDLALFETDPVAPILARLDPADVGRIKELERRHQLGDTSEALQVEFSEILARAYVVDDALAPRVARRLRRADETVGALLTADLRRIEFDCKPGLASFEGPVLIVQGELDVMPRAVGERIHAVVPNSRLLVLEGSGHYGWLDRPRAYIAAVRSFFETSEKEAG